MARSGMRRLRSGGAVPRTPPPNSDLRPPPVPGLASPIAAQPTISARLRAFARSSGSHLIPCASLPIAILVRVISATLNGSARHLLTSPGRSIDPAVIASFIARLYQRYNILGLAYDRWRCDELLREFDRVGLAAFRDGDDGD